MTSAIYFFDLGNTRCKFWRVEAGQVTDRYAAAHGGYPERIISMLPSNFHDGPQRVCGISVMGDTVDEAFIVAVKARWGVGADFARVSERFGELVNGYSESPSRLGIDRWMGLIAAAAERDACCVVSCGTAITIDVVERMQHKGGYILPGLGMMRELLGQGTRRVQVARQEFQAVPALGVSTVAAVCNGALAAVVALIERTATDHAADRVLLTGGDARVVGAWLTGQVQLDPDLLLAGMMRYFDVNWSPPAEGSAVGG